MIASLTSSGRAMKKENAGVAQLVEQLICNQQVDGSNPFASSSVLSRQVSGIEPEAEKN